MSNDPYINSALFNFCNKLDDGPRNTSTAPRETRSAEDLAWLRSALAAIESPDKILKQHLQVLEIAMGWDSLGGGKKDEKADNNKGPEPTYLKKLATGEEPVTLDDFLYSLEWLVEELEDINMASEMCLMNGHRILLNLLQVSSANFIAPHASVAAASAAAAFSARNANSTSLSVVAESDVVTTAPAGIPNPQANCFLKEPPLKDIIRNAEVRALTAKCIAHAVQQNLKPQQVFALFKWAEIVLPIFRFEIDKYIAYTPSASSSSATEAKNAADAPFGTVTGNTVAALLHLCSCMCRENDEGTKAFIVQGGITLLEHILARPARVSAKILKRAMFLVEYFASIGISNKGLIQSAANIVMLSASTTNASCSSSSSSYATAPAAVRVSTSSSSPAATTGAVSDPIEESFLSHHADDETKDDCQRAAASCLIAILDKGASVVKEIVKPMGVGTFLNKVLPLVPGGVPEDDVRWVLAKALQG